MEKFSENNGRSYRERLRAWKDYEELKLVENQLDKSSRDPTLVDRLWAEGKQIEDLYNLHARVNKLPPFERRNNFLALVEEAMLETVFDAVHEAVIRERDSEINRLTVEIQGYASKIDTLESEVSRFKRVVESLELELRLARYHALSPLGKFLSKFRKGW